MTEKELKKKSILKKGGLSIVVVVVSFFLALPVLLWVEVSDSIFSYIVLAGVAVVFLGGCVSVYQAFRDFFRVNRVYCDKCGSLYNYENDISWEQISENRSTDDKGNVTVTAQVAVLCQCHECGCQRKYTHEFKTVSGNNSYSLNYLVEKFFEI